MRHLIFATGPQGLGKPGGELRQRLGAHLSGELGERVELYPCESYSELQRAVHNGTVAIAWLAPAVFVEAQAAGAARLLARASRWGTRSYRGAVFVRDDSLIDDVVGLHGASMAWVDPDSCSGHLFPREALGQAGFRADEHFGEQRFCGSHTAVARAVAAREVDAGATYVHLSPENDVRNAGWDPVPEKFRMLLTSEEVPSDTICATASLEDALVPRVRDALVALGGSVEGRELLEGLFQCVGFEAAEGLPEDYAAIARIRERLTS